MRRTLEGAWSTTASGRPTFDVFAADVSLLSFVIDALPARGFAIVHPALAGLDMVIARVQKHGIDIHVGWDIWSGLFIYADAANGDPVVREIADWLAPQLPSLGEHASDRVTS